MTNGAGFVDQVDARPVLVSPGLPDGSVAVHGDGKREFVLGDPLLDPVHIFLSLEFRSMHANNEEVLVVLVCVLPGPVVRVIVDAVDASVRPEMDNYHLSFLFGQLEGLRVYPDRHPGKLGSVNWSLGAVVIERQGSWTCRRPLRAPA